MEISPRGLDNLIDRKETMAKAAAMSDYQRALDMLFDLQLLGFEFKKGETREDVIEKANKASDLFFPNQDPERTVVITPKMAGEIKARFPGKIGLMVNQYKEGLALFVGATKANTIDMLNKTMDEYDVARENLFGSRSDAIRFSLNEE